MLEDLTGPEAARVLVVHLAEYQPWGEEETWSPIAPRRHVMEVQAHWTRACLKREQRPTLKQWSLIVESAYRRAQDELEPSGVNWYGEEITLKSKIEYWRQHIPEARGNPCSQNMLQEQRRLQTHPEDEDGLLLGNLLCWRNGDLEDWMREFPGASPTEPGPAVFAESLSLQFP